MFLVCPKSIPKKKSPLKLGMVSRDVQSIPKKGAHWKRGSFWERFTTFQKNGSRNWNWECFWEIFTSFQRKWAHWNWECCREILRAFQKKGGHWNWEYYSCDKCSKHSKKRNPLKLGMLLTWLKWSQNSKVMLRAHWKLSSGDNPTGWNTTLNTFLSHVTLHCIIVSWLCQNFWVEYFREVKMAWSHVVE